MFMRLCTIGFAGLLIGQVSLVPAAAGPVIDNDTVYNGDHPGQSGPNGPGNGNGNGGKGGGSADGSGNGSPGRSGPGNS